ncbi:phosphopantetheine-binding protein [Streptomyces sp. NPDC047108]|uniref:phosphopantetheine-binding protein n=1 Tax=Streptomyces sp. NPDC047108 TaxID=3155025 RepID=UPI0033E36739
MNVYESLKTILIDELKISAELVTPEASLEDIECDSLTLVELSLLLERDLGVDIEDHELKEVPDLAAMGRLLEGRLAGAGA